MAFSWTATTFCGPPRCNLGSHAILWAPNLLLYGHPRNFVESHAICLDAHIQIVGLHEVLWIPTLNNWTPITRTWTSSLALWLPICTLLAANSRVWASTFASGNPRVYVGGQNLATLTSGYPRALLDAHALPGAQVEIHANVHTIAWRSTSSHTTSGGKPRTIVAVHPKI